ncbi:hypothetical protein Lepto7375DRAFT_0823 [Leptolyngbya sp. PCC 7375]|nr:hypothetical protein Lepto7375DRAFT_0823 [Leptolyngbya sp. PCC 7375]
MLVDQLQTDTQALQDEAINHFENLSSQVGETHCETFESTFDDLSEEVGQIQIQLT